MNISNPNENAFLLFKNEKNWKKFSNQMRQKLAREPLTYVDNDNDILSDVFFSKENYDLINKELILNVYKKSRKRYLIGPQRIDDMTVVMRWVWNEYSRHLPYDIPQQIKELNSIVVKTILPDIITEFEQRIGYLKDIENPLDPIPLPKNTSISNKTLRSTSNVFHEK